MVEDGVGLDGTLHGTTQPPNSSGETSFPYSLQSLKGGDLILSVSTPTERPSQTSPQSVSPLRTSLSLTEDDDDEDVVEDSEIEDIDDVSRHSVQQSLSKDDEITDEQENFSDTEDDDPNRVSDVNGVNSRHQAEKDMSRAPAPSATSIAPTSLVAPAVTVTEVNSPIQLSRPPIVPPLRPRDGSPKPDETRRSVGLATRSDKALTAVDLTRSTHRRDSESLSSGPPTPTTERLKASHKEEVINFLRQVISSERALRTKVAELKDERESVQVNNYRFEHILRRCVGEQAMELESVKKTVEATQQKAAEERNQRKLEEWRRQKAERHLARYRQRLMTLRQIALSAQQYLAHAEALLTEQAVQDEIAHVSAAIPHNDKNARAIAAVHIQRRRDLWRLRQQQNGSRDMYTAGKSVNGMTPDDLMLSSPHECIAQKALEDIEVILDIIRRTFKIEAEMLEGESAVTDSMINMSEPKRSAIRSGSAALSETKEVSRYDASIDQPPTSSTARVYRLLRKIEKEISSKSQGFKQQQQQVQRVGNVEQPGQPPRRERQLPHQSQPEQQHRQEPSPQLRSYETQATALHHHIPPPAKSPNVLPPIPPSKSVTTSSVLQPASSVPAKGYTPVVASRSPSLSPINDEGEAVRHVVSSSCPPPPKGRHSRNLSSVTSPLRATPMLRGFYNASSLEWPQKHLRELSMPTPSNAVFATTNQTSGSVVYRSINAISPFPAHASTAVHSHVAQGGTSPTVFKQPPRIMRVGLRRQVASLQKPYEATSCLY